MAVAFFDLDSTLLEVNSAKLWVRREYRLGRMSWIAATRAGLWMFLYKLGLTGHEDALLKAISTLAGKQEAEMAAEVQTFWDEEIDHRVRPGAISALEAHRQAGDRLVLLTSSSPYMSRAAVAALDLDDWISTRFEVVDGVFTGGAVLPLCYLTGKLHWARQYAEEHGFTMEEAAFYTDSIADVSVLEHVGRPFCVHPDRELEASAQRNAWPVLDWDAPAGA